MGKYAEKISDDSLWLTATPSPAALTLPFYVSEAGHFRAERDYLVERRSHDSYLLLYTVNGCGSLTTDTTEITLSQNRAAVINCRKYHKYHSLSDSWEFFWIHFNGSAAEALFAILYPDKETDIAIKAAEPFQEKLSLLLQKTVLCDLSSSLALSMEMHALFGCLIGSTLQEASGSGGILQNEFISSALDFIKNNYSRAITINDMIARMPVSKYHFIRLFRRVMGLTPYSYLTAYRITMAKTLLRTTDKPISTIAEECGFADPGNFISHFKKRTGQKPLQYRRDFS